MARQKSFDREQAQLQALELFWRKGYSATSIDDLVNHLHLSRSSLYDTFGDKRSLFLGALERYGKGVIARIAKRLHESPTPIGGLQQVFDDLLAGVGNESGAMGCFMVNSIAELAPYDAEVTEIATAYNTALLSLLTDALTKVEADHPAPDSRTPAQWAVYVFNTIQGLRVLIKSGATRAQVEAIAAITIDSLR